MIHRITLAQDSLTLPHTNHFTELMHQRKLFEMLILPTFPILQESNHSQKQLDPSFPIPHSVLFTPDLIIFIHYFLLS